MRFSKTSLKAHIWEQIGRLEKEYGFDYINGSDQLKTAPQDTVIAYGAYEQLHRLLDDIEYGI